MTIWAVVFFIIAWNAHLFSTMTESDAGEKLNRLSGRLSCSSVSGPKYCICLLPNLSIDYRLNRDLDPLFARFQLPFLVLACTPSIVRQPDTLGGRILKESADRCIRKLGAIASPM